MKKVLKYIVTAFIIIGIAFLYSNVDKQISVFDKTVDTSLYGNMGELTQGLCVQQTFTCQQPVLDGISIKVATYGLQLSSTYQYQIVDADSGEIIRSGELQTGQIENSKFHTIEFDQITDCKNQKFIFKLESDDAVSGNAFTIYNVPKGEEEESLLLNEDEFPNNTLAMRTVSHMFDMETFVTVIFSLTYLCVFILILFKFFS